MPCLPLGRAPVQLQAMVPVRLRSGCRKGAAVSARTSVILFLQMCTSAFDARAISPSVDIALGTLMASAPRSALAPGALSLRLCDPSAHAQPPLRLPTHAPPFASASFQRTLLCPPLHLFSARATASASFQRTLLHSPLCLFSASLPAPRTPPPLERLNSASATSSSHRSSPASRTPPPLERLTPASASSSSHRSSASASPDASLSASASLGASLSPCGPAARTHTRTHSHTHTHAHARARAQQTLPANRPLGRFFRPPSTPTSPCRLAADGCR